MSYLPAIDSESSGCSNYTLGTCRVGLVGGGAAAVDVEAKIFETFLFNTSTGMFLLIRCATCLERDAGHKFEEEKEDAGTGMWLLWTRFIGEDG